MSNPRKRQRSRKRELFTPPETNAAARNLAREWERRRIMHGHCLRRHGSVPHTHSSSSSSHARTEGYAEEREVTFVVLEGPRRRDSNADGRYLPFGIRSQKKRIMVPSHQPPIHGASSCNHTKGAGCVFSALLARARWPPSPATAALAPRALPL